MSHRFAKCTTIGLIPAGLIAVGIAGAEPVIMVDGDCPDELRFSWEGATPSRQAWLLVSPDNRGFQTPPGFPCGGVYLDIGPDRVRIVAEFDTGADGRGAAQGRTHPAACGLFLQMVVYEGSPCEKSNVAQVPQ